MDAIRKIAHVTFLQVLLILGASMLCAGPAVDVPPTQVAGNEVRQELYELPDQVSPASLPPSAAEVRHLSSIPRIADGPAPAGSLSSTDDLRYLNRFSREGLVADQLLIGLRKVHLLYPFHSFS